MDTIEALAKKCDQLQSEHKEMQEAHDRLRGECDQMMISISVLSESKDKAEAQLKECVDRLVDMYIGDDGQAWQECENYLKKYYPKIINKLKRDGVL